MAEHVLDEFSEGLDSRLSEISRKAIGAAIAVHRELGAGFPEPAYQKAFAIELRKRGIEFAREVRLPIVHSGEMVGLVRLDFVIEQEVIIELKAVDELHPIHTAQVVSYLKASKLRLGIIINFNVRKLIDGVKRVAL